MKVFKDTGNQEQSAYFGWQNKNDALFMLREGYKNGADDLVEIAIEKGDIKTLDTYIFPILFSYRHCLEISLKNIYMRVFGKMLTGGHDLIGLWDVIKKEIVDGMICSEEFVKQTELQKKNFILYKFDKTECVKIRSMLKELQEANQKETEAMPSKKQVDQKAEVWRYLISRDEDLFFTQTHFVDYYALKEGVDYIYQTLGYIYYIMDEYLSG